MKKILIILSVAMLVTACGDKKPASSEITRASSVPQSVASKDANRILKETVYKDIRKKIDDPVDLQITHIKRCAVKGNTDGNEYVVDGTITYKNKDDGNIEEQKFIANYTNIDNVPSVRDIDIEAMFAKLSKKIKGKTDQEDSKAYMLRNKERMMKVDENSCVDVDALSTPESK